MKEHVQKTGVRRYAGDDFIELQAEPLKVIQSFFEKCGNCVINGCEVIPAGNKYNVSGGIVSISGTDADGVQAAKVVPFAGVDNVTLPIYLTLTFAVSERVYGDGKVKPIAYNYTAVAAGVQPAEGIEFLEITSAGGKQFVDAIKVTEKLDKIGNGKDVSVTFAEAAERANVSSGEKLSTLFGKVRKWFAGLATVAFTGKAADLTQDASNRLVTDTEKTSWANKYTRTEVDSKDTATLQSAKEYASDVVNTLSGDVYRKAQTDSKDAATLQAAKEYAAAKVAEIVNSSPGTLDTLSELAAALGNDPNFATSIMALIGGKADRAHGHAISEVTNLQSELNGKEAAFIKNTAFNKNFGTVAGTIAAGNHGHTVMYTEEIFVGGNRDTYYPVRISIKEEGVNRFVIRRHIHINETNTGSLRAEFIATKGDWGGYVNFIKCMHLTAYSAVFIANCMSDYSANMSGCIVWLKGDLTYFIDYYHTPGAAAEVFLKTIDLGGVGYPVVVAPTTTIAAEFAGGDISPVTSIDLNSKLNAMKIATTDQLDLKANANHNHDNAYAPKTHLHSYEPAFNKNSGFNKNLGTTAGTVAEGNHTHADKILCTGKVAEDGRVVFITPGFSIYRIDKGVYRIGHTIGHTNYGFVGNGYYYPENRASFVGMRLCTDSYCEVCNYWGSDGFHDSTFSFTIFGQ